MGLVLVAFTACRAVNTGVEPGAASSEQAVQEFLNGAREPDLQAMSAVWGDEAQLTRDRVPRAELEQRLLIMACHLRHTESRIGAAQRGEGGRTVHAVELAQDTKQATVNFTTARNARSGRWFVANIDLTAVRDFCSRPSTGRRGV